MRVGLQIKFQDNGNIKNQILIIDKPGFRVPSLTYEKVFKRGELDVVEYYCNEDWTIILRKKQNLV
jgi:hypothetical protein